METTLALATLMGAGLLGAKLAQLIRLPSVTGFICTGLLLGPSGLALVELEHIESVGHFSEIALMLIAFGIGEHIDWRHLRKSIRSVGYIGVCESSGACVLVAAGTFAAAWLTRVGPEQWGLQEYVCLAALLGGVATATAPAATVHVMRELRASGPLTRTLMAVVAVDDALAIIIFGVVLAVVSMVVGSGEGGVLVAVGQGLVRSLGAVLIGVVCGLLIDLFVHRLRRRGEMLTAGLACILLAGEASRLLELPHLLTGMAAGATIVNRDRRDVRVFRTINDFEPPIYALFFTLAGAHLELKALVAAGVVGLTYTVLRVVGKMSGAYVGATLSDSLATVRKYLGFALVPQAGVAIGLILLIQSAGDLQEYAAIITPVVLAGVVLSELFGPLSAKFAVTRAGEAGRQDPAEPLGAKALPPSELDEIEHIPWTWPQLPPPGESRDTVVFGVRHPATAAPVARISTLLAYYYQAQPLALAIETDVVKDHYANSMDARETEALFEAARLEAEALGYPLRTSVEFTDSVPDGIVAAAGEQCAKAIVLGHPLKGSRAGFRRVVDSVAERAEAPVVVVRLAGPLHTERILVPIGEREELVPTQPLIHALSAVAAHEVTILHLLPSVTGPQEVERDRQRMSAWVEAQGIKDPVHCEAVPTDSRLETILNAAGRHDIIIMTLDCGRSLRRAFFGSLAEEVADHCSKPMLLVGGGACVVSPDPTHGLVASHDPENED